jgi:iron complex transport system ATP-binding protein
MAPTTMAPGLAAADPLEAPGASPSLEVSRLSFSFGKHKVLDELSFVAHAGDLIALLGPNGVGKSTLMRCVLGFERAYGGSITICGRDARALSAQQMARQVAYIPQSSAQVFDFTVLELVLMGTAARLGLLSLPGRAEQQEALAVLDSLGIAHLAHRGCGQISGGEYQMALLSRALLQHARILLMDEPTASLDYGNQYRVMERIATLARRDFIVLFSAHDPNQVLRHASRALILQGGTLVADGYPADVMSPQALSTLYGIEVSRHTVGEPDKAFEVCIPYEKGSG